MMAANLTECLRDELCARKRIYVLYLAVQTDRVKVDDDRRM